MTADTTPGEKGGEASRGLTALLLGSFALPMLAGILVLLIEYKSGLFEISPADRDDGAVPLLTLLGVAVLSGLLVACLAILARSRRFIRESFSLVAWLAQVQALVLLAASIFRKQTPWDSIGAWLKNEDSYSTWSEWLLLLVAVILLFAFLRQRHRDWRGLRSIDQYRREQRRDSRSLAIEAVSELKRIVERGPRRQVFTEAKSAHLSPAPTPDWPIVAWKEQAKDLLRLSSSSFNFLEDGWHDQAGCWVGSVVDTGQQILLFPFHESPEEGELRRVVQYAVRLEGESGAQSEIIVAILSGVDLEHVEVDGRVVRVVTEGGMLDRLVDFSDYRRDIKVRAECSKLPDSELTVDKVYVAPGFGLVGSDAEGNDIEDYVRDWLIEPGRRQLAVLGEYGQGKSTAALMLTHRLLERGGYSRVPILVELRGTSPRNLTPLQLLGAWCARYNISPQALMRLHAAGRTLLIFEGFDEMALVGDAEMRLKHFYTLWEFAGPMAKIIITGRPNFFLDEMEMKAALGIEKPIGDRPYCEALKLRFFNVEKVSQALRSYPREVRSQILSVAERSPRFCELVSRPSLLFIVSVLWEKEALSQRADGLDSADVLDLFVRHSYRRQGLKESESPAFMTLSVDERDYFMRGIATFMAAERLPNRITKTQLIELVRAMVEVIPDSVSQRVPATSREVRVPLRARLHASEHDIEEDIVTDVRACGLLVSDPAAMGTFRFGHKSFMEFLFAKVIAETIRDTHAEVAQSLTRVTNARISHIISIPESIGFLAELVRPRGLSSLSGRAGERAFALRLLYAIFGMRGVGVIVVRWALMEWAFVASLRRHQRLRSLAHFLSPTSVLMSFLAIPVLARAIGDARQGVEPFSFLILVAAMLATLLAIGVLRTPATGGGMRSRQFSLWNFLCLEVGISSQTLHDVAFTGVLPWARSERFDYFVSGLSEAGGGD